MIENEELVRRLWRAGIEGTRIPRAEAPPLDAEAGYAVQAAGRSLRVAAGARVAGRKVGLTSAGAQRAMGAAGPVSGYLIDSTVVTAGPEFDCARLVAPRVEVEVAFVLARALEGPDVSVAEVLAATAHVAPALEVVDSRWEGGAPGVGALVADNVSAAAVIVGDEVAPSVDLAGLRVTARIGENTETGDAGNVLGDPARAVAWLCADLHRRGERLEAGDLILSGALCGPVPVRPGDAVSADFGGWGRLEARFTGSSSGSG